MAHTPGPWKVDNKDFDRYGPTVWVEAEKGPFICELVRNGQFNEGDNARLIAAAPDLLQALEQVRDLLDTANERHDRHVRLEAYRIADAVLTKFAVSAMGG